MAQEQGDTVRTMLTLAAITYRGVYLALPEPLKRARLRALMDECMARFSAVRDKWKIVWGPAGFSAVSPGLDDALIYVAQSTETSGTVAIAIRGTNPVSLTDWVFGDLMITHQVPWLYGDPAATQGSMISASTALGLSILQDLRWNEIDTAAAPAGTAAPAAGQTSSTLFGAPKPWFQAWIDLVKSRLISEPSGPILGNLEARLEALEGGGSNPLALLRRGTAEVGLDKGTSLKDFLRTHAASYGKPDVYVSGHSKGGALSSTLALWLADTQGPQNDSTEEWDRERKTAIHCFSFAGPTAGNGAFATHSDATLQDCQRVWNVCDVVPHAFVPDELTTLSTLYELGGLEKELVDGLTKRVADMVRPLSYRQICGSGTELNCELLANLSFSLQAIHQHLDSYLENLGLTNEMSAATLLAPTL